MPGFLYYTPDGSKTSLADCRAAGLGYAFDAEPTASPLFGAGPDGGRGAILADDRRVPPVRIGYYADKQVWRKIPGSDWWCGHYRDADAPAPADLERPRKLDGHVIELADGRPWLVPVARQWREIDEAAGFVLCLPKQSELGEDGQWRSGQVLAKYRPFWDVARKWFRCIAGPGPSEGLWDDSVDGSANFLFGEMHRAAALALSINYAIGEVECGMLGILTRHHCEQILDAVIDEPTFDRWLKKKAASTSAGSSMCAGPEASGPSTPPP